LTPGRAKDNLGIDCSKKRVQRICKYMPIWVYTLRRRCIL